LPKVNKKEASYICRKATPANISLLKQSATESTSLHHHLEKKSVAEILRGINEEDYKVALAVKEALPQIEALIEAILPRMQAGGRLFYLGAGTSGRLGVVDASELPPTFGASPEWVIGLIAGGDGAIRKAVEFAEDNPRGAWQDMQAYRPQSNDSVVGIAASGTTPYVVGGVEDATREGLLTGCITCNHGSPLAAASEHPVEVVTGPEYLTGSTRMKAGTAQKMALNMLSTALMIKLGRVKGNRMVDMQLSNQKLLQRGTRMVQEETGLSEAEALRLLEKEGSVRKAVEAWQARPSGTP